MCNKVLRLFILLCAFGLGLAHAEDFFKKANGLYDQGKYAEAIVVYRAAIREGQYEPFAWFNLGNSLVQLNKYNLAMVAYKRATELAPKFVKPWVLLGDLYYINGDIGLALSHYTRARELGEEGEHIDYATASCYLQGRDYLNSERYFERVLRSNPDRLDAWFGMAEGFEKTGDYGMAVSTLKQAIQLSARVNAEVYFTLAYYELAMDSTRAAMMAMEDGLMLSPANVSARRHLAQLYLQQGSPWMAIFTLEQGLQGSAPGTRDLYVDLGQIYFEQKRYEEALAQYVKAWKQGSHSGRIGVENVANTWFNLGDKARAESVYALLSGRSDAARLQ